MLLTHFEINKENLLCKLWQERLMTQLQKRIRDKITDTKENLLCKLWQERLMTQLQKRIRDKITDT